MHQHLGSSSKIRTSDPKPRHSYGCDNKRKKSSGWRKWKKSRDGNRGSKRDAPTFCFRRLQESQA